jgi:hypothetical protein
VENGYYMSMLAILVYAVGMGITAKVIDATEEREKEDRKAARQAARQAAQSAS